MEKRLTRIPSEAVLGGVAAGMADYFNIDKTIVRVLWAVALLLPIPPTFFWTAIVYIVLWAALPEASPTNPHGFGTDPGVRPDPTDPRPPARESGMFTSSNDPDRAVKIIGVVLLGIGAIMLLDELPYWYRIREYIWPVALIGVGAYLLLRQRDKEQYGTGTVPPPPPADPRTPSDPFPPVEPNPYRPYDSPTSPGTDPDAPADPDGETKRDGDPPQIR
jgi:phage shock protein C